MSIYLYPICDLNKNKCVIQTIYAKDLEQCQNKIIETYTDQDFDNYTEFLDYMDKKDIIIGTIYDKEEF